MKQKRFTRNIHDKQDYCEFEVKDCPYQSIYGFDDYEEIEDNIDCDLSLAIDKLGHIEDFEQEFDVDLEIKLKVEAYYMRNYKDLKATAVVKGRDGKLITVNLYHFFPTAVSVLYPGDEYCCGQLLYKDYGKTWALTKEEIKK